MKNNKMVNHDDFNIWLTKEFTSRCKINPKFSVRAFAALLEMDSSSVSQLMSGKRKAAKKMIIKIGGLLGCKPEQLNHLLQNYKKKKTENSASKSIQDYKQLSADLYEVISEWHHYAILELTFVDGFESSPQWISRKLGITAVEAKEAIKRLLRLELLRVENFNLIKTDNYITNYSEGLTSGALKSLQKKILKLGLEAIESTPQKDKDITSMTMAISPEKLPAAKRKIKEFRRELCEFLEDGCRKKVYHMGVQLYPVSK